MKYTILFIGLLCLGFNTGVDRSIHVFMIGDSTMSNKPKKAKPETGWGQVLQDFFNDSVIVNNHAQNGISSKSFRDEGLWDSIINKIEPGDYVIIQFGHNDNKPDPKRYTDPFTTYTSNLLQYINETKEKGGIPVLCTPIVRRHFNNNGTLINTHGEYIIAAKQLAEQSGVFFIDLEAKTRKYIETAGPEKSKELFLFIEAGIFPNRNNGCADSTHLSVLGAYKVASLAVEGMKEAKVPLIRYLLNE